MGASDVGAASFEFYEGIRIVLPGSFAVALANLAAHSLDVSLSLPTSQLVAAILASVAAGLLLYFIDAAARSDTYANDLPSLELSDWGEQPPGFNKENICFVMLDDAFPTTLSSRALYWGSIFRIGFESIYLLAAASLA